MKNEELMKIEAHKKTILLWENELIMNLLQNVDKSMDLYVIDKKWFKDYKNAVFSDKFQDSAKIRNYNSFEPIDYSNIIYNKSTINPISDFVLLNKKSMESFSPKVVPKDYTKMKISVKFLKRKMISRLLSNFFYFYYVDKSNTIKEGFFIFENEEIIKGIINNFLDNDIKDFINQYFKNKNPSLDKNGKIKLYHLNEFDLILKLNEDQYFDRKEIYNIVNLSLDENENNKNKNEVIKNKIYNYKIKENLEYKKKDKSKSKNNKISHSSNSPQNNIKLYNYHINFNNDRINNSYYKKYNFRNKNDEIIYNSIINCIYEYFYSQKEYETFINKESQRFKIFMPINKDWINSFLLKCSYNKIKKILLKEKSSLKFKEKIKDYLIENNIYKIEMIPIPSIYEKAIKNKYIYYDNYEIITEKSYKAFSSVFDIQNNNKVFSLFIILSNYILIKYNHFSGEIREQIGEESEKEKYFIFSEESLEEIQNNLLKYGLINGLSIYNINIDKNIKEWIILDKKKKKNIGILINLNLTIKSLDTDEDNEILNNEEEVFEIESKNDEEKNKQKNLKISKNIVKEEDKALSIKRSINKNLKIENSSNNNFIIINNERENNLTNIINMKENISESHNTEPASDKYLTNYRENNNQVYHKKNNISYYFEQKKSNIENILPQKYQTPLNNTKRINYFNKPYLKAKNLKYFGVSKNLSPNKEENKEEYLNNSPRGLIGLTKIKDANLFMNTIIQCLSNIPRFREELLKVKLYQELYKGRYENQKLSFSLANIFKNLWQNHSIKNYTPENFKNVLNEMNPLLKWSSSNNSKDLIIFILETIHNELNREFKGNYIVKINDLDFFSTYNDFVDYYKRNNKSIISEEFYGFYNSMLKCCSCNTTNHNIQVLKVLFFPLEEVRKFTKTPYNFVTLENCFEYYSSPKALKNGNLNICNYCKKNYHSLTQNKIIIAPKTIIINLNRGKGLQNNIGIQFNQILNLKKYIFNNEKSPFRYELIGVISNLGTNDMGGNYISYCKNSDDGEWYKYNDEQVTKSSFQEISKIGLPYVFFYSNIEV